MIEGAEGLILTTSKAYENSGTLDALQAHRNDAGKATFAIGPLLPLQYGLGQISNRGDDAIKSFMDAKLEKYGEKSVLFVSLYYISQIVGNLRPILTLPQDVFWHCLVARVIGLPRGDH